MSNYEININPSEIDPDGTTYRGKFKKINDIGGSSQGGSVEIPTCTVKFVSGKNAEYGGFYSYTKCENGVISTIDISGQDTLTEFDIVLENVVCGSLINFSWWWQSTCWTGGANIAGGAKQIGNGLTGETESYLFIAPTVKGEICTIELWGEIEDV